MNIRKRLLAIAEKDYQNFSSSLLPNVDNVLGVRIPLLRKLAKEIYKETGIDYLAEQNIKYMEEVMLQGMLIGFLKDKPEKILEYVENFIPKINNWSVCDCFCAGLKFTKENRELVWNFIQTYLNSDKEYYKRFGLVMILDYFADEDYIERIFSVLDNFSHEGYYARMGAAWALSICYIKQPQKTFEYLKLSKLDDWTFNKGIQKICESLRVDNKTGKILKGLKR